MDRDEIWRTFVLLGVRMIGEPEGDMGSLGTELTETAERLQMEKNF